MPAEARHAGPLAGPARALLLLLAACGGDVVQKDATETGPGPGDSTADDTADDTTDDTTGGVERVPGHTDPWLRDEERAPGSVTLTEILYDHPESARLEWVELHNPFAYAMDLSGWSLQGGVSYTFAEGTILEAGGYLVVAADPSLLAVDAYGPYEGSLSDSGERVELYSNGGRRMDMVAYGQDEPWPAQADGSGLSLAKVHPTDASDHAENWSFSAQLGGTPGEANGIDPLTPPVTVDLIALDATWTYDEGGAYPDAGWADADYDDSGWASGEAPLYAGEPVSAALATVRVTADNYYGLYLGEADGTNLRLVAEDEDGDWTSVESYEAELSALDHLYVAAWEAPGSYGGPQMVIAEVEVDDEIVGTSAVDFEWVLGPEDGCPGTTPPDPVPDEDELLDLLSGTWELPAVEADPDSDPWGWALSSSFDPATQYIWVDTFGETSVTNTENTYALFRSVDPVLGGGGTTELAGGVVTTLFRARFTLDADPSATELFADCEIDDGAVFYLNGVEVARHNLPDGAIDADTLASAAVDEDPAVSLELSSGALVRGENVLAVEVHQAEADDPDMLFGCALSARVTASVAEPTLALHEVSGAFAEDPWVELANDSALDQELGGLILASSAGDELSLPAGTLPAGELTVVEGLDLGAGDMLYLYAADRSVLLDAVRISARTRGRDEEGAWRYPSEDSPGEPNVITRTQDVVISEILYHRAPLSTDDGYAERPEEWIELYNRGSEPVDLSGWQLVDGVAFDFPEGTLLGPDARLVVSNDADALRALYPEVEILGDFTGALGDAGDRILLLDASGNPADEVRYHDGGRWPEAADGGGSSLELMDPWANNAVAESWAASDEQARTRWVTYEIEGAADPSAVGPDGTWDEFVMGLLDAGEVLLDDLSVVEDPDGSAVEVLQNGSFEDTEHWRPLGTHRHSEVIADPDDPDNSVLRLVATGPTEHMHNHAETTLTRPVRSTDYRITFRARPVWGSNQLHTRLYFNRLPRTTLIEQPEGSGTPGEANSTAVENLGPSLDELAQDVAVPAPGQSVEIGVVAEDPDGVARVTLWSAVDGGAWGFTDMVEEDGRWSASLEGQSAGAIVQFYVEAEDGLGETATLPAAGADSRALVQFDDGEAATNGLHNLRLILTEADSDWMLEDVNLMSNDPVGGTVVYDESEVFYDVGVRTKGSERGRPEDVRLGYAVRFNPEQLFRGSHTSALIDRSEGVGFGQRELLLNLVMMRAGVVSAEYNDLLHVMTPRSTHTGAAELQLDRSTGLVLASQFEDGDEGPLFDYELIYYPYTTEDGTDEGLKLPQPDSVVGTSITDLGEDKEDYRWNFTLQNHVREDDYTELLGLCEAFSLRGTSAFLDAAGEVIDVDQWMRGFAVATLAGAVDNYGGDSSQHNARFYVRPEDRKVLYFPHDLDFFGSSSMAVIGNTDLYYLIQDPVYERLYYQHLEDLLSRAYNLDYLSPWCDELGALLPAQDFDYNCSFIEDRHDWVSSGSSDSVASRFPSVSFAITTNGGEDLSTSSDVLLLEGEGWVDVREIWLDGEPLEVSWTDGESWQARVSLVEGANELSLEAYDLGGELVGSDTITVTVGGG